MVLKYIRLWALHLIIFDEDTSSLDHESEKAILNSIKSLSKNKTIITIAHRLSSILNTDFVMLMDEGQIVAVDKHENMKGKIELYDVLFKKQYNVH